MQAYMCQHVNRQTNWAASTEHIVQEEHTIEATLNPPEAPEAHRARSAPWRSRVQSSRGRPEFRWCPKALAEIRN